MANIQYQNPNIANVSSILDSEVIGIDATTQQELRQESVVPKTSISGNAVLDEIKNLLELQLIELKRIRMVLEIDVAPGVISDVGEIEQTVGAEDAILEGLEEH